MTEPWTAEGEPVIGENARTRPDLSFHILPACGTMVGVCVTLIGLVKVAEARIGPSRVDEYGALVSLLFLAGSFTSYMSLRHPERPRFARTCEKIADRLFLAGLVGLTAVSMLFAYEII